MKILTTNDQNITQAVAANTLISTNVYGEVPTGSINGINTAYTLANTPDTGTVRTYVAGVRAAISGVAGAVVTLAVAPPILATVIMDYEY